jgi:4-amino-4-deoxy-L-arabinose transferase-like glycosyltransferase
VTTRADPPTVIDEPDAGRGGEPLRVRALQELARHRAIAAVLGAGVLVRILTVIAYNPLFWFTDTYGYLKAAHLGRPEAARPFGYSAFLWLCSHLHLSYRGTVVLQHLMVVALAGLIYAFLVHRGVTRWIAALAVVPLALSPLLVNIEHHLLSDPVFITCYASSALLLAWWNERPPLWACGVAGVLAAAAALTRQVGMVMVLVIVGYVVLRRFGWRRMAVFLALFALPLLAYLFWMHETHGVYAFTTWRGKHLYARVAPIARCEKLGQLTAQERQLCDDRPLDRRPGPEGYLWVGGQAPARSLPDKVDLAFARKVIVHQPFDYLSMVATDISHVFYVGQRQRAGEPCVAYWSYPGPRPGGCRTDAVGTRIWEQHPFRVNEPLANALRQYARLDYLVGPFFLACVLFVLFAALWHPRRGDWRLRLDALLLCLLGVGVTLGAIATANFSYRYTVALYCTLAPAAALALTHLLSQRRRRPQDVSA